MTWLFWRIPVQGVMILLHKQTREQPKDDLGIVRQSPKNKLLKICEAD